VSRIDLNSISEAHALRGNYPLLNNGSIEFGDGLDPGDWLFSASVQVAGKGENRHWLAGLDVSYGEQDAVTLDLTPGISWSDLDVTLEDLKRFLMHDDIEDGGESWRHYLLVRQIQHLTLTYERKRLYAVATLHNGKQLRGSLKIDL